jgi:hypothetical protein
LSPLVLAAAMGLALSQGAAYAQSTTGSIHGTAPTGQDVTILIQNSGGLSRVVPVGASGRYNVGALPVGTYTVTLQRGGKAVQSRDNVTLLVGAGADVSFSDANQAANTRDLAGVEVTANALPPIDVTGVDSRTVVTAEQLERLPLERSAEAVALLAPGASSGSSYFTSSTGNNLVSFGGSSVTENAYYINGFNTTDPLNGLGGIELPYGAMAQEQVLSGGYGAAYGRSAGGVINMVGKSGTNEWHFGGQLLWTPKFAKSDQRDIYYVSGRSAGQIYDRNTGDKTWVETADAYFGGPLIKDRLYIFGAAEWERTQGSEVGAIDAPYKTQSRVEDPKVYAKLDWNINDSNILEVTGVSSKHSSSGSIYDYDYDSGKEGAFNALDTVSKYNAKIYTGKFTSYITDDLTASVLYGKMKGTYYSQVPDYDPTMPYIRSPDVENPAITGGRIIGNDQIVSSVPASGHRATNTNLRVDLTYQLGDHALSAGIDNQNASDINSGSLPSGPGYNWQYGQGNPTTYIIGKPGDDPYVDAPGAYPGGSQGYYVARYIRGSVASARTEQRAQYVEDSWQVNDRWLVKLGLRNDQFSNYTSAGVPSLRLTTPQWAPRVGFSWDVNGDSSFKIYGNAGRYYLALPASVALRGSSASLYTLEYFTYTGIDSNGIPTGLTPIANSRNGPISINYAYGNLNDPKAGTAADIKSQHQDEFILGFDKNLSEHWVYGAKATVRKLKTGIDDFGDINVVLDKLAASGVDMDTVNTIAMPNAYLFNPGSANTFRVPKLGGGYYLVPLTNAELGFPHLKRNYYGLNLYLEHAFDNKWFGRFSYLYSRSYGNMEGQVRSDIGQSAVSSTADWDYWQPEEYANGELANSRRHQLKAYGYYQIDPQWIVSGNLLVQSGTPRSCLGLYGPDQTNPGLGYGSYYHWCDGQPSRPGDVGNNPWQYILSVGVKYRPAWADHKLAFSLLVDNLLNQRVITQTSPIHGSSAAVVPGYNMAVGQTTPRYARFGITYDF